jgi:hypothetical protein
VLEPLQILCSLEYLSRDHGLASLGAQYGQISNSPLRAWELAEKAVPILDQGKTGVIPYEPNQRFEPT